MGDYCENDFHIWGPAEVSRMAGTPHRKCINCRAITLDVHGDDDDEPTLGDIRDRLLEDGGAVPCSRYGRHSADCASVVLAMMDIYAEANGDPYTHESADYFMGLVVNDSDSPMDLIREHGNDTHRATIDDDVWAEYAPRWSLSSGSWSADTQLSDVIDAMSDAVRLRFLREFPEWPRLTWESSWIDADASGVDIEYSSWAIEWIESHTNVLWEDGEPFIQSDLYAREAETEIRLTDGTEPEPTLFGGEQ